MRLVLFAAALLAAALTRAALPPDAIQKLPPPAQETVRFGERIQPILEARCVNCHGRGKAKGGFAIDNRETFLKGGDSGPAVVVGKSAESLLIELVSGLNPEAIMPEKGTKLTSGEVSLLRAWIDQGLKWDEAVSFSKKEPLNLKPRQPELPAGSATNPVDRFLAVYFKTNKLKISGPVEDRVFARRVYLDSVGLLPTVEELERFVASKEKNKRELLARELLARDHDYAQHWLTFWNDALRNDYRGTGYIDGGRKQITQWLYSALATNKPFDKFVAELINPTPASEGFVKGIIWRGVVNASQTPEMQAAQNISQVFMGVNLKCASCHDSFINDWTLADAYGLASVYSEHPLELVQCDKPLGKTAAVQFIFPDLGKIDATAPKKERLQQLAEVVTSPENGRLSRTIVNRLWARFFGRGLVERVDDMDQPAWNPDLLDYLAADLANNGFDLKRTISLMLASNAYAMPSVSAGESTQKDFVFRGPLVRRLSAEQFLDALGAITGVWNGNAAAEISVGDEKLDPTLASDAARPQWIWSSDSAGSRAAAETIYFRKTIELESMPAEAHVVATCDNAFTLFINGRQALASKDFARPKSSDIRKFLRVGQNIFAIEATNDPSRPGVADVDQSNPAGLFLHARIRSKKGEIRDFASDATWRWSAEKPENWKGADVDDSQWTAAAQLGHANAGPWGLGARLAQLVARQNSAANARAALVNADLLMVALGRPNREQVITTRASTATTLQALEMTNGNTLARRLKESAENLAAIETDPQRLIDKLYNNALCRKPTASERNAAKEFLGATLQPEALEDFLWTVCMLPEFQLIR